MGNTGWAGSVLEDDYAWSWALGGVDAVADANAWKVSAGTGRQVLVAADGAAFAKGILSDQLGTLTLNLPTPSSGQGRWYLIVRRIDWSSNPKTVTAVAVAHSTTTTSTPAASPTTYPVLESTPGVRYDHVLAWAWVNANNTSVSIWDLRKLPLGDRYTGRIDEQRLSTGGVVSARLSSQWWSGSVRSYQIARFVHVEVNLTKLVADWTPGTAWANDPLAYELPKPLTPAVQLQEALSNQGEYGGWAFHLDANGTLYLNCRWAVRSFRVGGWLQGSFTYLSL